MSNTNNRSANRYLYFFIQSTIKNSINTLTRLLMIIVLSITLSFSLLYASLCEQIQSECTVNEYHRTIYHEMDTGSLDICS